MIRETWKDRIPLTWPAVWEAIGMSLAGIGIAGISRQGGMRMLTRIAGLELAGHKILVVGVGPGMANLRIVGICSNVAFITYAVMLNLPPILILHVILLPLNGWRLAQELQSRRMVQRSSPT